MPVFLLKFSTFYKLRSRYTRVNNLFYIRCLRKGAQILITQNVDFSVFLQIFFLRIFQGNRSGTACSRLVRLHKLLKNRNINPQFSGCIFDKKLEN
jgi:hypothetical protein